MFKQSSLGHVIVVDAAGYDVFVWLEDEIMRKYLRTLDADKLIQLIRDERQRATDLCVDLRDTKSIEDACNKVLEIHKDKEYDTLD